MLSLPYDLARAVVHHAGIQSFQVAFLLLIVCLLAHPNRPATYAGRRTGWLFWWLTTVPVAYTLLPAAPRPDHRCTWGDPVTGVTELFTLTEPALNVWLFIPAGAAVWLLTSRRTRIYTAAALVAYPTVIEMTQRYVTVLNRACQYGDIFNNTVGVLCGLTVGAALWLTTAGIRRACTAIRVTPGMS